MRSDERFDGTRPAAAWAVLPCIVAAALVRWQAAPLWQARWVQDDAYVSFRYARHLVEGHGLVYNVGARVEGYSNFLWTMLAAVPLAAGRDDPIGFMHAAGMALWVATYGLLAALGVRLARAGCRSAPLALLPLFFHWSYNMWFVSGMETPLATFLTVAALWLLCREPRADARGLGALGLTGLALTMTRADGMIACAGLVAAAGILDGPRLLRGDVSPRAVARRLLPAAGGWAAFNLWRVAYYGSFFPNTYYAKVAYLSYYERGWEYLRAYLSIYPFWWLAVVVLPAALAVSEREARRLLWGAVAVAGASAFYVVRLGGDFMEWRFLMPATAVFLPALVVGADVVGRAAATALLRRSSRRRHGADDARRGPGGIVDAVGWLAGASAAVVLSVAMRDATPAAQERYVGGQETIPLLRRYADPEQYDWGAIGHVCNEVLPANAHIATTSAGIIPFFCERPCLDLCGLTDPEIAHEPVDPENRGRMGHEHWLQDYEQMRARGANIFLFWGDPKSHALSLVTPPREHFEVVSARLPNGKYFEFAILDRDRIDVAALRRDPRLVFFGDVQVADRNRPYVFSDLLESHLVADTLDIEDATAHEQHGFEEIFPPDQEPVPNFHDKMLPYVPPRADVTVFDVGRIIGREARWTVHGVDPRSDLTMIVRHDGTSTATYRLVVNGTPVDARLSLRSGPEAWDETTTTIPAAVLVAGDNQFRLLRDSPNPAELYYMWFLQKPSAPPA